jgi:Carboxypeptidase regulatory-like domain
MFIVINIFIFLACSLLSADPSIYAQSATATLSGTVEDENGAVIPKAEITVLNPSTTQQRQTLTSSEGIFTLTFLPPGRYIVTAKRDGFAPVEIKDVVLNVNDQRTLSIRLKVGTVGDTVNVIEDANLTQIDAAINMVVDRQFVKNLPLNGRSLQSLITLTPGIVLTNTGGGQFSVNGQRSNANYVTVDGVSANIGITSSPGGTSLGNTAAGSLPGLTTFGGTNGLISIDALKEFKIQTSTYSSEYGRSPGGQISLVTRSGENQFRGTLFEYFRNEALDANDWFANSQNLSRTPLRHNQFGGTLGGPIILPRLRSNAPFLYDGRNRTFFFFSYEGLRLRLPRFVMSQVPSLRLRQNAAESVQPLLHAFPLPTGPEFLDTNNLPTGEAPFATGYSDPVAMDATSTRIDHTINNRLTLFGRYNYSPSTSVTRDRSTLTTFKSNSQTLTIGSTLLVSSQLTNEVLVNYSRYLGQRRYSLDDFGGASPVADTLLFPPFAAPEKALVQVSLSLPSLEGGYVRGTEANNIQRQINIVNNLSLIKGSHQLKLGIDYRRLTPIYGPREYVLQLFFNDQIALSDGVVSQVNITAAQGARPIFTNFSAYTHDTWKISRRLTANYGLRWEFNPPPIEASGNGPYAITGTENLTAFDFAPPGTPLYKTSYTNFAPRVGLAYLLSQRNSRELVLRGGFGIFYDLGNTQTATSFGNFPYTAFRPSQSDVPFPLTLEQAAPPTPTNPSSAFSNFILATDPKLKLPFTLQWNATLEQALGSNQTITASYVAAVGRRLLRTKRLLNVGNGKFAVVDISTNGTTSDYHSLQLRFQRRLSRGVQALASYTWSHAIDEASGDSLDSNVVRGSASFDVRHNFSTAITYDLPTPPLGAFANTFLRDWSVDSIFRVQSAAPVTIIARTNVNLDGTNTDIRPNLLPGVPLYIDDLTAPGGKRFNKAAFQPPRAGQQGNLGRNTMRGFTLHQLELALRRQFSLTEELKLQFRAEAFNLLNHPNFGPPARSLTSSLFGQSSQMLGRNLGGLSSLYQIGGPRSLQFALRLEF